MVNKWEQIAQINKLGIGAWDWYSKAENLEHLAQSERLKFLHVKGKDGEIAGFLLYWQYDDCLEGLRSGVLPKYQGKGVGKKLYKRMMRLADKLQLPYWTYSSAYNYASVNAHVQAGMRIKKVWENEDGLWVDLIYHPRKKKNNTGK